MYGFQANYNIIVRYRAFFFLLKIFRFRQGTYLGTWVAVIAEQALSKTSYNHRLREVAEGQSWSREKLERRLTSWFQSTPHILCSSNKTDLMRRQQGSSCQDVVSLVHELRRYSKMDATYKLCGSDVTKRNNHLTGIIRL
jgi:hypothetical protein